MHAYSMSQHAGQQAGQQAGLQAGLLAEEREREPEGQREEYLGGLAPGRLCENAEARARSALQIPLSLDAPESERALPRPPLPRLVLGSRLLSIRIPPKSAIVSCQLCSKPFAAKGPTGYYEDWPICDRCMLEQERQLGMVLALSIFTRTYARLAAEEGPTASEAAIEMLAFARIYEDFASRYGSPRTLDFNAMNPLDTPS